MQAKCIIEQGELTAGHIERRHGKYGRVLVVACKLRAWRVVKVPVRIIFFTFMIVAMQAGVLMLLGLIWNSVRFTVCKGQKIGFHCAVVP